ncbi:MAG: hypothetical protein Kow0089_14980 [Desulfobulbaceae bacterium]
MNSKQNRKRGTCLIVLLIMACFIPTIAGASPLGQGKGIDRVGHHRPALGIWQDQKMVQELGLSKEQIKHIRNEDFTFQEKRLVLKAQLDSLRLQMDKSSSDDVADDAAVLSLAQKISDVKGKMFVQKIQSRLTLGKILNAEQIEKLKSLDRPEKKRGPKEGKRHLDRIGSIKMPGDNKPFDN